MLVGELPREMPPKLLSTHWPSQQQASIWVLIQKSPGALFGGLESKLWIIKLQSLEALKILWFGCFRVQILNFRSFGEVQIEEHRKFRFRRQSGRIGFTFYENFSRYDLARFSDLIRFLFAGDASTVRCQTLRSN